MPTAKLVQKRKRRRPAPKQAQKPVPAPQKAATPAAFTSLLRLRIAPAILLGLITFAVYFQVIHHPFSNYDDGAYVGDNLKIQKGVTSATLRWALTSIEHANWHPLTWLSHALDWQLFGPNPSGHHATSLLLHMLNVVLLFLFLAEVTQSTSRSLLVAALFAVHPLNVESVAWVAERKNVLCALFFMLALLAYARYARRPSLGRYLPPALLFAFALMAKAMAVTLPFVLLLLDFWPLRRIKGWSEPSAVFPAPQLPAWKVAVEKLPLLVLSAGDSWITFIAQQKDGAIGSAARFPLSLRVMNAIVSYAAYLWKAVWPAHLSVLYPYPSQGLPVWQVVLSALLLAGLSAWVWRERSRRPYLMVGWCWFLGMLVPVIGLIQVGEQGMADRYAYLPLVGIFVMAVWGLADVAQKAGASQRRCAALAAAVTLALFSFAAWRQARFWRSNLELWSHAAAVTKRNWEAEDVIGSLLLVKAMNAGAHYSSEAQVHFQKALEINPRDAEALSNIGGDLEAHGKLQEAMEKFRLALQYVHEDWLKNKILNQTASAYEQLGDFKTARQYYREALKTSPATNGTAFVGFARTFTEEKIAKLTAELAVHPVAQGYVRLGQMQESAGNPDAARASYQKALLLDSKSEAVGAGKRGSNGKP
ncbi:MAG: hypothetical protein WAM69_05200 [Candidatus Sulfotelmatobacter sp.]